MTTQTITPNSSSSKASSLARQVLTQTQFELLLTLRRGENILVTLIVPVLLLIFFASLNIVPAVNGQAVNFLLPGILALAIMAAGMVNLGIATAYERYYGVLKRLGSSPLPRTGRRGRTLLRMATDGVPTPGALSHSDRHGDVCRSGAGHGRCLACRVDAGGG